MKLEVSTCIGQQAQSWSVSIFLDTWCFSTYFKLGNCFFEFSPWFLFVPTIFLYQEVGIWSVSHVPGIISGMAEFLGIEATHGSCIWFRDLGTHTGKHCFHASLVQIFCKPRLFFFFTDSLPLVIFSSQVHRDPQPRMNFLCRNLGAFQAMEIFHPAKLALAFFCHPDFTTTCCSRHN